MIENQGPIDELGELVHTNVCRGFSSSQYSLDAPEQFFERKGLWQLVVCAKFEPFHLVFDLVAGREHDDGNVRFSSDLSKRGEAVHTRHHDIEQNEIGGKVFYGTQTVARIGKASSNYNVNFQRFPTLDAKKLVNAPKMSAHHRGICHF